MKRATIHKLRNSIHERDWNKIGAALDHALLELGCDGPGACGIAIAFVEMEIRSVLPEFIELEPGDTWVASQLDGIDVGEPPPDYSTPGSNSFAGAIEALGKARGETYTSWNCRASLVSALLALVMFRCDRAWGLAYPDRWASWFRDAEAGQPSYPGARGNWLDDPIVRSTETVAWEQIVSRLVAAQRSG
jgi:hypothetical protein